MQKNYNNNNNNFSKLVFVGFESNKKIPGAHLGVTSHRFVAYGGGGNFFFDVGTPLASAYAKQVEQVPFFSGMGAKNFQRLMQDKRVPGAGGEKRCVTSIDT